MPPTHVALLAALALASLLQARPTTTDEPVFQMVEGRWAGSLERGGTTATLRLDLRRRDGALGGTFDWPELGYLDAPILGARVRDGQLRIALPLPLGSLALSAAPSHDRLAGTLTETTRRAGDWVALPSEGTFALTRSSGPAPPYRVEPVRFHSGSVKLAGAIYAPTGTDRKPAVVFIHGSGSSDRSDGAFYADQFARAGIVTLVYDKRGSGESAGDWRAGGYEELAADARAGLALLAARPDVDAARVGYVARSEGGWVAPKAVAAGGAAFLGVISGPAVTVAEEDIDHYRVALREGGIADTDMEDAFALVRLRHAVIAGHGDQSRLDALLEKSRSAPWFPILKWDEGEAAGAEHVFRARTIDNDPAGDLRALGIPSLWVYGTDDVIIPVGGSISRLLALQLEPRPLIHVLPRADHALAVVDYPRLPGGVATAARLLSDWINDRRPPK